MALTGNDRHPFWMGAAVGALCVQSCSDCGHATLLGRGACPSCLSESLTWVDTDPVGLVESVTRVDRPQDAATPAGYGLALVRLDAGPCLLTRTDHDLPHIGQRVRITFELTAPAGDRLPVARP